MIRNFMRVIFPKTLGVLFIISIIGVVIAAFSAGRLTAYHFSLTIFISVLLPGCVGSIVAFGIIYVLLDIRDVLQDKKQE